MNFDLKPAGNTFRADWGWLNAAGAKLSSKQGPDYNWPCRSRNGWSGLHFVDSVNRTHEIAWVHTPSGRVEFGAAAAGSAYKVFNPGNTADIPFLPRTGIYWISFLGPGESWADVLEVMSNSRDAYGPYLEDRAPILDRDGNRYTLRQSLHLTTYRKIAADEQALLNTPHYDSRHFGDKLGSGWVTGAKVPDQYFLRKGIR